MCIFRLLGLCFIDVYGLIIFFVSMVLNYHILC